MARHTAADPSGTTAHTHVFWRTSEFLGILHVLASWMLQRAFPLQLIDQSSLFWSFFMRWTLGLLLLIAGSVTISAVHRELFKFNQSHKVGHSATALVTTGPFAVSRHPTYASAVFLFVPGVALLWNNAWAFLTQPLAMLAFYYVLIRPEEAYLLARFPEEYKRYRQQTRRWI